MVLLVIWIYRSIELLFYVISFVDLRDIEVLDINSVKFVLLGKIVSM